MTKTIMFKKVADIVSAELSGQYQLSSFRKVPSQATVAGTWCDLSMASGNPSPNFYSWLELTSTAFDWNKWIYHGQDVSTQKVLKDLSVQTTTANATPLTMVLCDYLMFYPQVDMDSLDPQPLVNDTPLPRYESGEGVRMFLVAQYPYVGWVDFSISYTNSAWVAWRSTWTIRMNTATFIGSFTHGTNVQGSYAGFLPLQSWDKWVRSVESITFTSPAWWLGAIVLVKPLATITLNEITAPSETSYAKDITSIPEIKNGAYLNFIACPNASLASAPIFWTANFVFN